MTGTPAPVLVVPQLVPLACAGDEHPLSATVPPAANPATATPAANPMRPRIRLTHSPYDTTRTPPYFADLVPDVSFARGQADREAVAAGLGNSPTCREQRYCRVPWGN
jgi:hypothetical protein